MLESWSAGVLDLWMRIDFGLRILDLENGRAFRKDLGALPHKR